MSAVVVAHQLVGIFILDDDVYAVFLKKCLPVWEQRIKSRDAFALVVEASRKNEGTKVPDTNFEMTFKRLGDKLIYEVDTGTEKRVLCLGEDYAFELVYVNGQWVVESFSEPWDDSQSKDLKSDALAIKRGFGGTIFKPTARELVIGPMIPFHHIPWGDNEAVTCVGQRRVGSVLELDFDFNFADGIKFMNGADAKCLKSGTLRIDENGWLLRGIESVWSTGERDRVELVQKNSFTEGGKLESIVQTSDFSEGFSSRIEIASITPLEEPNAEEFKLSYYGLPELEMDRPFSIIWVVPALLVFFFAFCIWLGKKNQTHR